MTSKVWDEITYALSNFNDVTQILMVALLKFGNE